LKLVASDRLRRGPQTVDLARTLPLPCICYLPSVPPLSDLPWPCEPCSWP